MLHRTENSLQQQKQESKINAINRNKALKEKSKNERSLKAELQQLELMRKYYEISCKQEIKRVCDRFDNRIAKHCFYKDSKKNNGLNDSSSINSVVATIEVINNFSPSRVSTSRISSRHSSGINKNNLEASSHMEFSKANNNNSNINNSKQPLVSLGNNIKNEDNEVGLAKAKKSVSWNSSSMNNMNNAGNDLQKIGKNSSNDKQQHRINSTFSSNEKRTSISNLNELKEKFQRDGLKTLNENRNSIDKIRRDSNGRNLDLRRGSAKSPELKAKARLGSSKSHDENKPEGFNAKRAFGRVISAISAVKAFNRVDEEDENETAVKRRSSKFEKIFAKNRKPKTKEDENINHFLDSLQTTDSGFYTYLNSKGLPTCSGYDNFGTLNKFNSASTSSMQSASNHVKEKRVSIKKPLINNLDTTFLDLSKTKKKLRKTTKEDDEEFLKSSSLLFNESIVFNQSNDDINSDYLGNNSPELKKYYDSVYRAQTTRNLTLKNLVV